MNTIEWWTILPFCLMLLCIAVLPLCASHWWENNVHKLHISLLWSLPTAVYLIVIGMGDLLGHQILYEYVPFIILLLALYIVTGGIHVSGDLPARPHVTTSYLAIGYVLASIMGTTGAAMLLIRPLINTIRERHFKTHTILFFIAAVANCGGLLTPLGDPPLFMLYLRGAEFPWFFNMFPMWLTTGVLLLGIYFLVDLFFYRHERQTVIDADEDHVTPIRIHGKVNFLYLILIVFAVAFLNEKHIPSMNDNGAIGLHFLREYALLGIAALSLLTTKRIVRRRNNFSWVPINEVVILFFGIFVTMTPALVYLNNHATELGLSSPSQFYYATGALSSILDNTPTALAFHTVAMGLTDVPSMVAGVPEPILEAIATGAVFFGAMTYIGNGPNLMVKAIAEEHRIEMPSFVSYIFKFSLIVLLPIYVVVQWMFF